MEICRLSPKPFNHALINAQGIRKEEPSVSSNFESLVPNRLVTRTTIVFLAGFTAALCWWIALAGVVKSAGGAIFLFVPAVATTATFLVASRQHRGHKAKHIDVSGRLKTASTFSGNRRFVILLCAFTAAMCWWIALTAVAYAGGAAIFLTVPTLATFGTIVAWRYRRKARETL